MSKRERTQAFLPDDDWAVLQQVCDEVGVPADVVEQMIVAEHEVYGMGRRHGIWETLEALIGDALDRREEERS